MKKSELRQLIREEIEKVKSSRKIDISIGEYSKFGQTYVIEDLDGEYFEQVNQRPIELGDQLVFEFLFDSGDYDSDEDDGQYDAMKSALDSRRIPYAEIKGRDTGAITLMVDEKYFNISRH
jgi:hypothetical protein